MRTQNGGRFYRPGARIAVFIGLCWLYGCIHLDRQIFGILAQSVKSDLALSDQQLGTLTASAFSIVYALLGLHFGRVADRADRLVLARTGALVWSVSCLSSAFVSGYDLLVATRSGVALGEAIATPAVISLMADLAGERYRAQGASILLSGAFVGAGAAAILGGSILQHFQQSDHWQGWRVAMLVAGTPGLLGALYLSGFRLRELVAGPASAADSASPAQTIPVSTDPRPALTFVIFLAAAAVVLVQMSLPPRWSVTLSTLIALLIAAGWARNLRREDPPSYAATLGQPAFRWLLISFAGVLFMDYACSFWLIPYAQRQFSVTASTAGTQLGGLMIVGGVIGTLFGGWAADRWRRVHAAGRIWSVLLWVLLEGLFVLVALAQTHYQAFVAAFAFFCMASGGWAGVAAAVAVDLVPAAHRGTGTAAYFLVTTILGPGLGPFAVGVGSDLSGSLTRSLAWTCSAAVIAAVGLSRLARYSQVAVLGAEACGARLSLLRRKV